MVIGDKRVATGAHEDQRHEAEQIFREYLGRNFSDDAGLTAVPAKADMIWIVYFITADQPGQPVNIGASQPELFASNFLALQRGSYLPLTILFTAWADQAEKDALHARFASSHIRGEWYDRSSEVVAFIDASNRGLRGPIRTVKVP